MNVLLAEANVPYDELVELEDINPAFEYCDVVIKRSMRSGFAGIENELFYLPETVMLFGDSKRVTGDLVHELTRLLGAVAV